MTESKREVDTMEMGRELSVCPLCRYKNGFHSMFQKDGHSGNIKWLLICPQCGKVFDVGLTVPKS